MKGHAAQKLTPVKRISGHVAAKGDFAGKTDETEQAKKAALTGVDLAIIPAGVPRKPTTHLSCHELC